MKIAILGSSPFMLMLAKKLSKNNIVHVYEKRKNIGGAWIINKYKGINYHPYSNIVSPLNNKDTKYVNSVNKSLRNEHNIGIKKNSKSFSTAVIDSNGNRIGVKLNTKKIFEYNFTDFFNRSKKKLTIKKKKIENIKIFGNSINICNKHYDKLYITAFAGINKIILSKKRTIRFPFRLIKSKHINIIANKEFIKNFYYSETFNDIFDRAQIIKKKNMYFFTARIAKKFKKASVKKILNLSNFNLKRKNILLVKKISFKNHFRHPHEIKKMINNLKSLKQIKVINTSQLFYAYKNFFLRS